MSDPIQAIKALGIPVDSVVLAAQAAGAKRDVFSQSQYDIATSRITGVAAAGQSLAHSQMLFGYTVQEAVAAHLNGSALSGQMLYDEANARALKFVSEQPWHWIAESPIKTADILRFIDTLTGVDDSTVATRVASEFDISVDAARGHINSTKKSEYDGSKTEAAVEIVRQLFDGTNIKQVINALATALQTTDGGARTFYYKAMQTLRRRNIHVAAPVKDVTSTEKLRGFLTDNPTSTAIEFVKFAEGLGIKSSTARTYYYTYTNEMNIRRPTNATEQQQQTKRDAIAEFMANKLQWPTHALINKLSVEFNISNVSARSYYYKVKKSLLEEQAK